MKCTHKFLFGKNGNPLKLSRRFKEKRAFPTDYSSTFDYVKKYFNLNPYFVRNTNGY